MLEEVLSCEDRVISTFIEKGLESEVNRILTQGRYKYVKIFVRSYTRAMLSEYEDENENEDCADGGISEQCGNSIELYSSAINYDTLWSSAQCHLKDYKRAYFIRKMDRNSSYKEFSRDENLILIYKDSDDIDFSESDFDGFELSSCWNDTKLVNKFNRRNVVMAVKKYKELKRDIESRERYLAESKKTLETFEKSLTDEEKLAIAAL